MLLYLFNNPPELCITWNYVFRRHCIDADPYPTIHFDPGPASGSGSLPQVIHKLESQEFFFLLFTACQCHRVVIIFYILDNILNYMVKSMAGLDADLNPDLAKWMPIRPYPDPQHWFRRKLLPLALLVPWGVAKFY
jgi:hypothetical protein